MAVAPTDAGMVRVTRIEPAASAVALMAAIRKLATREAAEIAKMQPGQPQAERLHRLEDIFDDLEDDGIAGADQLKGAVLAYIRAYQGPPN